MDPESMLARMCDTELPHDRDSDGNIFIDRNPKAFEIILEFLRTGELFEERMECTWRQLAVEADYFGLVGLRTKILEMRESEMAYEMGKKLAESGLLQGTRRQLL